MSSPVSEGGPERPLRILVLDDEPCRADAFESALMAAADGDEHAPPLPLHYMHTFSARFCRSALTEMSWDVVFLDHDLGLAEAHFGCFDPGDGTELVRWLTKLGASPRWSDTLFVVHSINPERGRWMAQELICAGFRACRRAYAWMDTGDLTRLVQLRYWPLLEERWDCAWPMVPTSRVRSVPLRQHQRVVLSVN